MFQNVSRSTYVLVLFAIFVYPLKKFRKNRQRRKYYRWKNQFGNQSTTDSNGPIPMGRTKPTRHGTIRHFIRSTKNTTTH